MITQVSRLSVGEKSYLLSPQWVSSLTTCWSTTQADANTH